MSLNIVFCVVFILLTKRIWTFLSITDLFPTVIKTNYDRTYFTV